MNPKKIPQQLLLDDWVAAQLPTPKSEPLEETVNAADDQKSQSCALTKQCTHCLKTLPISQFYCDPKPPHYFRRQCRKCSSIRVTNGVRIKKITDIQWSLDYSERCRLSTQRRRAEGIVPKISSEKLYEAEKRRFEKYPEKYRTKIILRRAIVNGIITKKPCEICGNILSEAHHEDYAKPLEVKWLCHKHHMARHVEINDERRRALAEHYLNYVTA